MMYNQKLAAAIKVNGKVLREFKDTVYIPYGSEYSILIKNLNTVRAVVNVFIDGDDIAPGGLVLNAGQEIDLERSIKNGNLKEGNRFKFIERTNSVEQYRGIKLEDGILRIEYQFEKPYVTPTYDNIWNGSPFRNTDYHTGVSGTLYSVSGSVNCSAVSATSATINDVGITVPGSRSDQKFVTTYVGTLEDQRYSMLFRLLGGEAVKQAVTVKHKSKCVTCGKQNKATAKFCTECGTALEIFA